MNKDQKIQKLLAVLDLPEEEQQVWVWKNALCYAGSDINSIKLGRYTVESLADLAFRLNGGLIAGKQPIEWIIDALKKELADTAK